MQPQQPSQSSSENDCYSTNEEYFLDICRFGEFDEIKEFLGTITEQTSFDWQTTTNSGDNFVHMLAGNNFPQIFVYLMDQLKKRNLQSKIPYLINKQNATGNTPLHYTIITDSRAMLQKLIEYKCDTSIVNQFNRTALDEAQMMEKFELAQILAPITKQDVERLKKEFGGVEVCDQDSDEDEEDSEKKDEKIQEKEEK